MKSYEILENNIKVNCLIEKSWRNGISISLSAKKGVVVRAPKFLPDSSIFNYIETKREWIIKNWIKIQALPFKSQKEYINGEEHYFLGNKYKLKICLNNKDGVFIIEDNIVVQVQRNSKVIVRNALTSWYHDKGVKLLHERYNVATNFFKTIKIIPASLRYKSLKGKWGACTHDNHIYLNPDLIKTSLACIDYVIYHELCHVMHHNHSKNFYKLLSEVMPDWKLRRKKLRVFENLI